MPHLFVTLTSDEFTSSRWKAFDNLEKILSEIDPKLKWRDAPVEAVKIFRHRLHTFCRLFLTPAKKPGIFGRVKHWIIRFENQGRGSLHAHMPLWIHEEDVEQVWSEITARIPGGTSSNGKCLRPDPDTDLLSAELHDLVKRKQMHFCSRKICRASGRCALHFPKHLQEEIEPQYNTEMKRYEYHRPRPCDRNIVEYHPLLLLLWGAHCNVQKCSSEDFSKYLMKYMMKIEPRGELVLDDNISTSIGLGGLTDVQKKAASAMFLSRPVSTQEAAMHLLGYSMIERSPSLSVEFISTPPPEKRMHIFKHDAACMDNVVPHAIDKYAGRPDSLENVTFTEYFQYYTTRKQKYTRANGSILCDGFTWDNQFVYKRTAPHLVRFSQYNPVHNPEAYFYNQLLAQKPFRSEASLLSGCSSYYHAYLKHMLSKGTSKSLEDHILEYTKRNLYSNVDIGAMLEIARSNLQLDVPLDDDDNNDGPSDCKYTNTEFFGLSNPDEKQAEVIHELCSEYCPTYHLLTGGPGCGKTFVTKHIANAYIKAGKKVLLAASTGAAARRLSKTAVTAHRLFAINPIFQFLTPLHPGHEMYELLLHADIIIIDEVSMLTASIMNIIVHRLEVLSHAAQQANPDYRPPVVLLVGDMKQLPPVCKCKGVSEGDVCKTCHISSSKIYGDLIRHELKKSHRCNNDDYIEFLNVIRHRRPTNTELLLALGDKCISHDSAMTCAGGEHTILCSHLQDTIEFNNAALKQSFTDNEIMDVPPMSNILDGHHLEKWRDEIVSNTV
eukprot:scaffold167289_cov21-Prasinocladus_malaysianus.AAC.1